MIYYSFGLAFEGAGTYTVSSEVIPAEAKRKGLGQQSPCPGDVIVFTCLRSEPSQAAVRWTADGLALYTFGIPIDIGTPNANQNSGFSGVIARLVNRTVITLTVDLSNSTVIKNNTRIACGEVVNGNSSEIFNVFVIGNKTTTLSSRT